MVGPPLPEFDTAFEALAAVAYRVAYRILGEREEARDVAQETLARAYARWSKVSGYAAPWVARVAANEALGRARRRRPAVERPVAAPAADSVNRIDLVRVLSELPRRQREVVVLRHLADLPEAEVARVLGCSVGTVKSQGHRGLATLRRLLEPDPFPGVQSV